MFINSYIRRNIINKKKLIRKREQRIRKRFAKKISGLIIKDKIIDWKIANNPTLTVALPVYNSPKILYLALESLKNQINVNFKWELLIMEEDGLNYDLIKNYINNLPNCVRITYIPINKRILLVEKWKYMGLIASKTSRVYVKQAADCYSSPKRLYIHNKHFQKKRCFYSTQPRGIFYNILNGKKMIYDGIQLNKNKKSRGCHLNMAVRTNIMRTLPIKNIKKGIDNYILKYVKNKYKLRNTNFIFNDGSIDKNNWKYSLDTDGYNNISFKRKRFYNHPSKHIKSYNSRRSYNYTNMEQYIPKYIIEFLQSLKK